MKYLISIYIWCVGIVVFTAMLIIGLILSILFPLEKYDPWFKKMMRFFFKVIRVKVIVEGDTRFEKDTPYLFMANHISLFDLPLVVGFIPIAFRGVASEHQFKWILYGWFMRRYGTIPIDRNSIHGSISAVNKAAKLLLEGKSVLILPEGGRAEDGQLQQFKKLPFHLARKAAVDIVPIGLSGLFSLKRKNGWLVQPQPIKIKFGEKIPAHQVKSLSKEQLLMLTRERIQDLVEWV